MQDKRCYYFDAVCGVFRKMLGGLSIEELYAIEKVLVEVITKKETRCKRKTPAK